MGFPSTIPDTGAWPNGKGRGLCKGCNRDLFIHGTPDSPWCATCQHTKRYAKVPLHKLANGRTEVLPQERPISDPAWRARGACFRSEHPGFDPVPIESQAMPAEVIEANALFCDQCPVRSLCKREADAHEYLGLWAGGFRNYRTSGTVLYATHNVATQEVTYRQLIRRTENARTESAGAHDETAA
jgi:hypothetical protein